MPGLLGGGAGAGWEHPQHPHAGCTSCAELPADPFGLAAPRWALGRSGKQSLAFSLPFFAGVAPLTPTGVRLRVRRQLQRFPAAVSPAAEAVTPNPPLRELRDVLLRPQLSGSSQTAAPHRRASAFGFP